MKPKTRPRHDSLGGSNFIVSLVVSFFALFFSSTSHATNQPLVANPAPKASATAVLLPSTDSYDVSTLLKLISAEDETGAKFLAEQLLKKNGGISTDDEILFLIGILASETGLHEPALNYLTKAYDLSPSLKDYIRYWIGKTLRASSRSGEALNWLKDEKSADRQIDDDIFWERVECLKDLKQWSEASSLLKTREKKKSKIKNERIKIKFHRGMIFRLKGQETEAKAIFKDLLINEPKNQFENKIISISGENIISGILTETELIRRAKNLKNQGLPLEALKIYKMLEERGFNLKNEMAEATHEARYYHESASLYQDLWDHPLPGQDRAKILYRLAKSYARSDQFEKALKYYDEILRLYSKARIAGMVQEKIPFTYFDSGQYLKAYDTYTNLLSKTRSGQNRTQILWYRFWASYLLNNYKKALTDLGELEKISKLKETELTYWKGRILEKLGRKEEAFSLYRKLTQKRKPDYYAFLSSHRLKGDLWHPQTLVSPEGFLQIPSIKSDGKTIHSKQGLPSSDPLYRAIQLAQIGLLRYAYEESESSPLITRKRLTVDSSHLLLMAKNYHHTHALGRWLVENKGDLSKKSFALAYPEAYPQLIDSASKKYGNDKWFSLSVMRQESAFKPSVESKAGAIGLMQIIPATGHEIAGDLGIKNFHPENLRDPYTNIQFGNFYLKKLLNQFNNKTIYALAGYNAGPSASMRWRKWGEKLDPDEFIELIPYEETKGYVKKVLTNYWMYLNLYE